MTPVRSEFEDFAAARWPILVRAALLMGCSLPDAEDLAQTTLAKCFARWPRVIATSHPDRYVYTMLLNQRRSDVGRRWHQEYPTDFTGRRGADLADEEDAAVRVDHGMILQTALGRLPKDQRVVVVARHLLDLSEAETAEVLGLPGGTVKSRLARGVRSLSADHGLLQLQQEGA
ncbi:MAG: SigE family RNA polymerase sigma factor [Nocardioides sp.]